MHRALTRRMAALSASLGLLSAPASAQVTGGVYLSLVYERQGADWGFALGWGAEASMSGALRTTDYAPCTRQNDVLLGFGPVLRAGFVGWGDGRISLTGLLTGRSLDAPTVMPSAEIGIALRLARINQPHKAESLMHPLLGARLAVDEWEGAARWTLGLDEAEVAGMPLNIPRLGPTGANCIAGRPCRDVTGALIESAPPAAALDAVIARWRQMAGMERDSIPAFLQLARELAAVGAPSPLVRLALRSARDEAAHTALCSAMVSRLSGRSWAPAPVNLAPTRPVAHDLGRLAVESWIDGCLGEGRAAAEARLAAGRARDPIARRVNMRIARDEARHAALGWAVLEWAVRQGGRPAVEALCSVRDLPPPRDQLVRVGRRDHRWGVLAADDRRHLGRRVTQAARARLDRTLAAA